MGAATRGGGAVGSGPANKIVSEPSKTSGPIMMAKGGMANKGNMNEHKRMAMGKPIGMMAGGMMSKGYAAGGAVKKTKGYAAGGKRAK
jgi:hypothetical protein